ncbi:class I SAM-dependent methyltransferase [bacterium]|nr:class I SAM-dependent methyltransferase [bacterium]
MLLEHDTKTPDLETSSQQYRARFSGAVGEWMLEKQKSAVRDAIAQLSCRPQTVLEVGGCHGQLLGLYHELNLKPTIQGSHIAALTNLQAYAQSLSVKPEFATEVSNLWELPFEDQSFDLVIAVRLLAHVTAWEDLLKELSRVARQAVIIDYPSLSALNRLTPILFNYKRKIEGNTRPYFSYTGHELRSSLRLQGMTVSSVHKQFAFPMGLHRLLKQPRISSFMENVCACLGITKIIGSPVVLSCRRKA